ncbi:MAG: M50 family metallopeptidase [Lachnospiraceae bacterium]|nr:M50 family metallopeptidase [Lachnospiraceae bacterium]
MSRLISAIAITMIIIIAIVIIGFTIGIVTDYIANCLMSLFGYKIGYIIANYITFPGVIHHELSHAFVAFITGAKIAKIELFKIPSKSGGALGTVSFIPRGPKLLQSIQLTVTPLAPIPFGLLTLKIIYNFIKVTELNLGTMIVITYIMISILLHMKLSKQDIKTSLKGLPLTSLLILIITYIIL